MRHQPHPYARVLPLALLAACATEPDPAPTSQPQIEWQRSLADARAVAAAEQRPLLFAVNMDGESASDRITHENYREQALVAATRGYVPLAASLFRHNPRDYDDQGRRIPCPRLGCMTCGEHLAAEPELFAGPLADGPRVAPRHVVVQPDGRKSLDLSLSFDLADVTRAIVAAAPPPPAGPAAGDDWDTLAALRSDAGRRRLEAKILAEPGPAARIAALRAIAAHGDAGSLDALRLCAADLPTAAPDVRSAFVATVRRLQLGTAMATVLREFVQTIAIDDGERLPDPERWLVALAAIDGDSAATKAFLAACGAVDTYGAADGLRWAEVEALAAAAREQAQGAGPAPDPFTVELPEAVALEAELEALDAALQDRRDDAELRARFAKASLDLARRRIDSGGRDVAILLADAELAFARALASQPGRAEWWIHRARVAFLQGNFAAQVAHARAALRAAGAGELAALPMHTPVHDATLVEALRWLGDGALRQFGTLDDAELQRRLVHDCLRALAFVATSPFGDDNDWTAFASACGLFGLWREQFHAARLGALRLPAAAGVRQMLHQALWAGGRAHRVADVGDAIVQELAREVVEAPERAGAWWYAGYAHLLHAENERRAERHPAAIAAYAHARQRFAEAAAAEPAFQPSCSLHEALCWLGQGFAAVRQHDRDAAAGCLLKAVAIGADLTTVRDGLGYDVFDLVDKVFEWRARGPSPVDAQQLFWQLDTFAPTTAFWAVAIADSQLREALRADGRNPVRTMRNTVDAAGEPIRMELGLPNDEGDGYLRTSIAILRQVRARLQTPEDRHLLAQADTIWAERNLERGRDEGVEAALREAAELLGVAGPAAGAGPAEWRECAARLRHQLGEARPRWRDGR